MNQKRIFWIFVLFLLASLDVMFIRRIEQNQGDARQESQLSNEEEALAVLRALQLPAEVLAQFDGDQQAEQILAYLFCQSKRPSDLKQWRQSQQEAEPQLYDRYAAMIRQIFADAVYFPVPQAADEEVCIAYENSWQSQRTYGGTRGHEGCDLMASVQ